MTSLGPQPPEHPPPLVPGTHRIGLGVRGVRGVGIHGVGWGSWSCAVRGGVLHAGPGPPQEESESDTEETVQMVTEPVAAEAVLGRSSRCVP